MAFDVLRSQNTGNTFPSYSFYSGIKDRYVSVTLQSDGDTTSQFVELEDAVAFYNKVPGVPSVLVRDDTDTSPLKKTYAFDFNPKESRRTPSQSIEKTIFINENRADVMAKFHLLNGYVNECTDSTPISRDDFLNITAILRSLSIAQISDLNNYFPKNIPVADFLNEDTLRSLSGDEIASLNREVPELSQFIEYNNIKQADIDLAIKNIPNLGAKLGLNIGVAIDMPSDLGDQIAALPGFSDYLTETDEHGKEYFPDGVSSSAIANSNFSFFDATDVRIPDANAARIEELIREGKAFFNPLGSVLTDIEQAKASADAALAYAGTITNNSKVTETVQGLSLLMPALAGFTSHVTKLTTVVPVQTTTPGLSLNSTLGTSLQNLIENPLGGLDADVSGSFEAVAAVESSAQYVAGQAASDDGDWDSLDPQSGFKMTTVEPIIGSLVSPTYRLMLDELCMVIDEISNYTTDRVTMCARFDAFIVRYEELRNELDLATLVIDGTPEHADLVAAEVALAKAITYFDERISNSIPLDANTLDEKIAHFDLIGSWIPGVLAYYNRQLVNIVVAETSGYRSATDRTQQFNLLDKSKAGATLLNTIATPELNQAARDIIRVDDNIIRTSIPLKRVKDDDFKGAFKLSNFVDPVMGAPYRLRNFERDYKGEINTFTSEDLKNNLKHINNDVLAPLAQAGFEFDVIRGLRPFKHEKGAAGKYNNSDHHYGLAVDIKLKNPALTGLAAAYIKQKLPWNKLVLYNFNQGSKANADAYIHISYYNKPSHGWDKNVAVYPKCGRARVIGGNGVPVPGFVELSSSRWIDVPALPNNWSNIEAESVQAIHLDTDDVQAIKNKLGLGNVTNTSDANKPISIAVQQALTELQQTVIDGFEIPDDSIEPIKLKSSSAVGFRAKIGLSDVNNTSDINKPISTAVSSALSNLNTIIQNQLDANEKLVSGGDETIVTDITLDVTHRGQIIVVDTSLAARTITLDAPGDLGASWVAILTVQGSFPATVIGSFDAGETQIALEVGQSTLIQSNGILHRAILRGGGGSSTVDVQYALHQGNGTVGPFTLLSAPASMEALTVTVGPLIQPKDGSAYEIVGDQIMFAEPIPTDTFWSEEIISPFVIVVGNVPPNSVGAAQIKSIETTTIKNKLGLDLVNNTSDVNKPVSTAQQAAISTAINDLRDEVFTGDEVMVTTSSPIGIEHNRKIIIAQANVTISLSLGSPSVLGAGWMTLISNTGTADVIVQGIFDDDNTTTIVVPGGSLVIQSNGAVHRLLLRSSRPISNIEGEVTLPTRETLVGDGSNIYELSVAPPNEDSILIFAGGAIQSKTSFTLSGTEITFNEPVTTGEIIEVYVVQGASFIGVAPLYAMHAGTNSTGPFTLKAAPYKKEALRISIGGILQPKEGAYTLTGDQIIFNTPISSSTYWEEEIIQPLGIGEPADNTVSAVKIKTNDILGIRTKLGVDSSVQVDAKISTAVAGVVESGSNANGDFVRFADGTQICHRTWTWNATWAAWGALYQSSFAHTGGIPMAANFIEPPTVSCEGTDTSGASWPKMGEYPTATYFGNWTMVGAVAGDSSCTIHLTATGRWLN